MYCTQCIVGIMILGEPDDSDYTDAESVSTSDHIYSTNHESSEPEDEHQSDEGNSKLVSVSI